MNKEMQMKSEIIKQILELKTSAINSGFDFPTQEIESATVEELKEFLEELNQFLESNQE
jgi:uncharacterized protein related to proFAR isomerase